MNENNDMVCTSPGSCVEVKKTEDDTTTTTTRNDTQKKSSPDTIPKVHTREDLLALVSNQQFVIVEFMTLWCGACQGIDPLYQELALQHAETVHSVRVTCDKNRETKKIAADYAVTSYPVFLVFENGSVTGKWNGADRGKLESAFEWLGKQNDGHKKKGAQQPAQKKDAAPEEETESSLQESFVSLATAVSQAVVASQQPQDPRPLTPTPEQASEEANTEQKDEEEVDEESCYTDEEDCDDDDEEYDDDEGSQDSDNSKCYTTAEEVGIDEAVLERMAKEAMEEDEKEGGRDDKQENESEKEIVAEADNPACPSPAPTKTPPSRRKNKITPSKQLSHRRNMMSSDITVDTTDTGIPNVIYIRHTSRPEIPDDEPFRECFNIPTPLRAKDMRKARRQRIQQKFVCRLRRWGIVRGKETLDAEDFECHVQTLIDL